MSNELVILPGWGLGVEPLQPLAQALTAALPDFHVQLQPLPSIKGQSEASILQQLEQQLPENCWLLGWSLGGMLATAVAAQRQSRCAGLITYASNACFVAHDNWPAAMPAATFSAFRQLCQDDLGAGLKRFALLCSQGAEQARQLSRQLQVLTTTAEPGDALAGLDLLAALDNRAAISSFTGAQLHVLAEADALVPASAAVLLQALNPKASVAWLGQSHASVMTDAPLLAQRIAAFIQGVEHA